VSETITHSATETAALGRTFARSLRPGDVVAMVGTLGSGKTCFVAGACQSLGVTTRVTSPTFTLINEYPAPFGRVAHIDLYRIGSRREAAEVGIEEYFTLRTVCFIEWPDAVPGLLPPDHYRVAIVHGALEGERRITISATTVCGAALVRDGVLLGEATIDARNVHAERLLSQIDDVLRGAGCAPRELGGIAVSSGPGSFTGLRIGMSIAKGLSYAGNTPLVGVPTLEALAQSAARGEIARGETLLAVLDARRDEVYCQLFVAHDAGLLAEGDVSDMTVAELRGRIAGRRVLAAGDAIDKVFGPADVREAGWRAARGAAASCSAAEVARVGERMLAGGLRDDPVTLEPRYIKEFFLGTR
jgi:tRNA threonylcarbamoyl adenosine modification protein YeaZ/tRNA threonylcarbamoyl adenosine modification protein YjeE